MHPCSDWPKCIVAPWPGEGTHEFGAGDAIGAAAGQSDSSACCRPIIASMISTALRISHAFHVWLDKLIRLILQSIIGLPKSFVMGFTSQHPEQGFLTQE
jgi:hypothetical protein